MEEDKEIRFTVVLPQKVLNRLKTAFNVRMMSGMTTGILESFVYRLLQQIEEGNSEYTFVLKKEV